MYYYCYNFIYVIFFYVLIIIIFLTLGLVPEGVEYWAIEHLV